MRRAVPAFLLLLAATAPAMPNGARLEQRQRAQAETTDEIITYRTKGGETLKSIAGQWFVNPEDWRRMMALNKVKDPDDLPAGTVLRLRSSWLKTNPITAELVAFRGDVRVLRKNGALPVAKGMELGEGDILVTGPNGFATLALPDKSQVSLPSASRIRLARLRQVPMSDSIDRRFTLEQGRSEARVTPMANPASRFLITTPVAVAAVRGTQFKVSYTPDELKAATVVTEGKVSVSRIGGIEDVMVRGGYGNLTTSGGATKAFKLLPAPAVDTPDRVQDAEAVTFRIKPVQGAVGYIVEIATDAAFTDRVGSLQVDGTEAVFKDVPNGQYHVRAFAVDALGLEGMPADAVTFQRSWAGQADPAEQRAAEERRDQLAELGSREGNEFDWFDGDAGSTTFASVSGAAGADDGGASGEDGQLPGDEPIIPLDEAGLSDSVGGDSYAALLPIGNGSGGSGGSGGGSSGGSGGGGGGGSGGGFGGGGGGSGGGSSGGGSSGGGSGNGGSGGGVTPGGDNGIGGSGSTPGGSGSTPGGSGGFNGGQPGDPDGPTLPGEGPVIIPTDPAPPTGNPQQPVDVGPGGGSSGSSPDPGGNGAGVIPEPATWMMMITGFGLVGYAIRRRRRLPAA